MRRALGVAGVLVVLLAGVVLPFTPILSSTAFAADIGTAPVGGFDAHCNVTVPAGGLTTSSVVTIACQYGPPGGTVQPVVIVHTRYAVPGSDGSGSGVDMQMNAAGYAVQQNAGGKLRQTSPLGFNPTTGTSMVWTTAGQTVATCRLAYSATPGTTRICKIDSITFSGGTPLMPFDYYTGGSAGDLTDVPIPTSPDNTICKRTLSNLGGNAQATFATKTPYATPTAATDTFSWAWGDAGTAATTQTATHAYTLSAQPSNGWTAVLTITRTPNAGHAFTDGTGTPRTVTCSLRVDYANPDQSTPASSTASSGDTDCPSGWGWLDPTNFVGIFKCMFIPSSFDSSSFTTTISGKFPFSVVADAYAAASWFNASLTAGLDLSNGGQAVGKQCLVLFDGLSAGGGIPAGPLRSLANGIRGIALPTPDSANCLGANGTGHGVSRDRWESDLGDLYGYRNGVRLLLAGLLWAGFVFKALGALGIRRTGLEVGAEDAAEAGG